MMAQLSFLGGGTIPLIINFINFIIITMEI